MSLLSRAGHYLRHPDEIVKIPKTISILMQEWASFKEVFIQQPYLWLWRQLKPNTTILDIGAFLGESALYFAMSDKVSNVYSYELVNHSYDRAKENIKSSPLRNKIHLYNLAVYNTDGIVCSQKGRDAGAANHIVNSGIPVKSVSLNTILKGKKRVAIKCDAEGAEQQIFNKQVDLKNVYAIMLEWHPAGEPRGAVINVLRSKGFHVTSASEYKYAEVKGHLGYICAVKQ